MFILLDSLELVIKISQTLYKLKFQIPSELLIMLILSHMSHQWPLDLDMEVMNYGIAQEVCKHINNVFQKIQVVLILSQQLHSAQMIIN